MKKMKGIMKKFLLVCCLLIANTAMIYGSSVNNILYQTVEKEPIASGVMYEKDTRLTEAGWLDVHTLEIDLHNPYVKVDVLRDTERFGNKDTLSNLATKNSVIAAVNGDYFNMRKNPTDIQGFEYEKGNSIVGKHQFNAGGAKDWASFIMDINNQPLIDFVSMRLVMTSEEGKELYVTGLNKLINVKHPSYYDRTTMVDTAGFDASYPGMCKLVIEDNVVTYQSVPGELVTVPENGFIIIMDEQTAFYSFKGFPVGTKIDHFIDTNIAIDSMNLAISGGTKVLSAGQPATGGMFYAKNQKAPRTSIGYNQAKDKLYMVVIDGRGSSIGVDQVDLAKILLNKGLYEAMHLDGGGSSTMVGRPLGYQQIAVLNKPSGGIQRKIPNGIGIVSTAPVGQLAEMKITANTTRAFKDMPITLQVIGYDKDYNPIAIDMHQITWETTGINGTWNNHIFYPDQEGKGTLTAMYNGVTAQIDVQCMLEPISMEINKKFTFLEPGESVQYDIMGIDRDGYRGKVNVRNVKWQLQNQQVGSFNDGGQFVAEKEGISLITGSIGGTNVYGYVVVAREQKLIDSFNTNTGVEAVVYPDTVVAQASVINEGYEGNNSIKLDYTFNASEGTQAAYVKFQKPYVFNKPINKLGLWVNGNGMGHWLRGKIIDGAGKEHKVSFANEVDWTGWQYVTAKLPDNMTYPIELHRIYTVSLRASEAGTWSMGFDGLTAHEISDTSGLILPNSGIFDPHYNKELHGDKMTMSVFGSTAGKNRLLDYIIQRRVVEKMDALSDISLFVGGTELGGMDITNEQVTWKNAYQVKDYPNVRIIELATSSKGMRLTDANQWKKFTKDLYATPQKHVIMTMNKNPLNGFSDKREGQLFHDVLKKFKEETGKNLFVINGSGYDFNCDYVEGISYMDVNGLWYKVHNYNQVDLKDAFYLLNFEITPDDITYNVMNVYPKIIIE